MGQRHRFTAALFVICASASAFGDLPPPGPAPGPGPGPAQCTVAAAQQPGEQCVECPASYEQPDKCQRDLAAQGYSQRCRAPGASVWHEVWCRGPANGPSGEKKRGCGSCTVGARDDGLADALALAALAGLALVARRRRAA